MEKKSHATIDSMWAWTNVVQGIGGLGPVFLSILSAVPRLPGEKQALGFARGEIVALIAGCLKKADPLLLPADEVRETAEALAHAIFAEAEDIHGRDLQIVSTPAYAAEEARLKEAVLSQPELLEEMGIVPDQKNIIVRTVKGDLFSVGTDNDGLGFATLTAADGTVVFSVTETFWKDSRGRAPPSLFELLARHELKEYIYRRDNPGRTFEDYHRLSAADYKELFDFAVAILLKRIYPRHVSNAIAAVFEMLDAVPVSEKPVVVTMDGPSGAGKSVLSERVAAKIGGVQFSYGKIYRLITFLALEEGFALGAVSGDAVADKLVAIADSIDMSLFRAEKIGTLTHYFYNNRDITDIFYSDAIAVNVSFVSAQPKVRTVAVKKVRDYVAGLRRQGIPVVLEGRVTGIEIAPDADVKFFVTADSALRAERRALQMISKDGLKSVYTATFGVSEAVYEEKYKVRGESGLTNDIVARVGENIEARDTKDKSREHMPATMAADAVRFDNSTNSIEEAVQKILEIIERKSGVKYGAAQPQAPGDKSADGSAHERDSSAPAIDTARLTRMIAKFFSGTGYTPGDILIGRPFDKETIDVLRQLLADLRIAAPEDILFLPEAGQCHITVGAENPGLLTELYPQKTLRAVKDKVTGALRGHVPAFNGSLAGTLKLMPDGVIILDISDRRMVEGVGRIRSQLDPAWYIPRIVHITIGRLRSADYTPEQLRAIQAVLDRYNESRTFDRGITVDRVKFGQFTEQAQQEFNASNIELSGSQGEQSVRAGETVPETVLNGKYRVKLDGKNRLCLPRELARLFPDRKIYLRMTRDGSLAIYNEDSFQTAAARVNAIDGKYRRALQRRFFASTYSEELDAQGRVVLDQNLRRKLLGKVAFKPGEEFSLVGRGDHFDALPARERDLADLRQELVGIIRSNIEDRIGQPGRELKIERELKPQFAKVIADNGNDRKFLDLLGESLRELCERADVIGDEAVFGLIKYLISEETKYYGAPAGHYLSRFEGEKKLHETLRLARMGHLALTDMDSLGNLNTLYGKEIMNFFIERYLTVLNAEAERHGGFLVRWGGDEWIAYLPPRYDDDEAKAILDSIREAGHASIHGMYSVARIKKKAVSDRKLQELREDAAVAAVSDIGSQYLVLVEHGAQPPAAVLDAINGRTGMRLEPDDYNEGRVLSPTVSMGAVNLAELEEARQDTLTTQEFIEKARVYMGRAEEKAKETKNSLIYAIIPESPHEQGRTILAEGVSGRDLTGVSRIPPENALRGEVDKLLAAGKEITIVKVMPSYRGEELDDRSMISRKGGEWMRFKAVNSVYGLYGGDKMIQLVYRELMQEFKNEAPAVCVARSIPDEFLLLFEGDEFIIAMPKNIDDHVETRLLDRLNSVMNAINKRSIVKVNFDAMLVDTQLARQIAPDGKVTSGQLFERLDEIKTVVEPFANPIIPPAVSPEDRAREPVRLFVYNPLRRHQLRGRLERREDAKRQAAFARLTGREQAQPAEYTGDLNAVFDELTEALPLFDVMLSAPEITLQPNYYLPETGGRPQEGRIGQWTFENGRISRAVIDINPAALNSTEQLQKMIIHYLLELDQMERLLRAYPALTRDGMEHLLRIGYIDALAVQNKPSLYAKLGITAGEPDADLTGPDNARFRLANNWNEVRAILNGADGAAGMRGVLRLSKRARQGLRLAYKKGYLKKANIIPLPRIIPLVTNASLRAVTDQDWMLGKGSQLLEKTFAQVSSDIDVEKLAVLNELNVNAFGITYADQLRGMHVANVLVPLAGRQEPAVVQVRAEILTAAERKAVVFTLYSQKITAENAALDGEERQLREMQLLGRGALAFLTRLGEDAMLRRNLRKFGLSLGDAYRPDVVEMSGSDAIFANPRAFDDEYSDLFDGSVFVYETGGGRLLPRLPESDCRAMKLAAPYLDRICAAGTADLNKLGLILPDKVIGDARDKNAYPWMDGLMYDRDTFPVDPREREKAYIATIYSPGVNRKSGESWTSGLNRMGERILPSALLGHSNRIGKLSDVEGYVRSRLAPAGVGIVQLVSLQNPGVSNLFAGDELLIDWNRVDEVGALVEQGVLRSEDVSGAAEARKDYVDRRASADAEFRIAEKVYKAMKAGDRRDAFREFAAENGAWLDRYARRASDARLAEAGSGAQASSDEYAEIYKVMQWLFAGQLRQTVAALAQNREKTLFSIDMNGESPDEMLAAVKHWFAFGFDGVQVNLNGAAAPDDGFFRELKAIAAEAHPEAVVTVKLSPETPAAVAAGARNNGLVVVRDRSRLGPEGRPAADEGIEIDSFSTAPADVNGAQDYYIRTVRTAMLSHAAYVFFRMGMLWGEEVDIDDQQVRSSYRMPAAGEARHRFDSSFLRRLHELGRVGRPSYEDAYNRGLDYPAVARIDKDWFASLNGADFKVRLSYEDGGSREVSAPGLHSLLKAGEILAADREKGSVAQEYYGTYFFEKAYEVFGQAGLREDERLLLLDYIKGLEKDIRSTDNREDRLAVTVQLFGFIRGIMENVVESRYADSRRTAPANETDRRILRSLLLVADSFGMQPDELGNMADDRTDIVEKLRAAAGTGDGKGLFRTLLAVNDLMETSGARNTVEVENGIRAAVNPLLDELLKTGTLPEAMASGAGAGSQRAAIAELLRIFDVIAEKKQPTAEDLLNDTLRPAVESFKGMFAAG